MTLETFIQPRAKNVLEVTGEISADFESTKEKFLEIQPACDYIVEKNFPDTNDKFDTVILQSAAIGNLENAELIQLIKTAAKFLKPRGKLLFTLDNIGYADNVMAILQGKPLQFKITLSKIELEDAIEKAGLNEFNSMNAARRVQVARGVAEAAKIDVTVFMYVISATPEELPALTAFQAAIGEKLACASKRVYEPLNFIRTEPNFTNFFYESKSVYNVFKAEDYPNRIFINQRTSFSSFSYGKFFFEKLSQAGYLYLDEMDDNPIIWGDDYKRSGYINFVGVHAIQTSTEYLAEVLRQFNPYVKVFENHLRKISPLRKFRKQKNSPVRIFFGAINRDEDFREILPILNQFAQKYGNKILFKIIAKKELFDELETKNKILVGDPKIFDGQFVPYEKYEETLQESDIALLPLLDNDFNRAKSDLKFIECAGNGAAVLASPVVYSSTVKDGETGFIFNNKKEFSQKLKLLIENKEKRFDIATAAYNYVKDNRLLSQHYEERLDWYKELFSRLDELNAAAVARIEKLAKDFPEEETLQVENTTPEIEGKTGVNEEIIIPDNW